MIFAELMLMMVVCLIIFEAFLCLVGAGAYLVYTQNRWLGVTSYFVGLLFLWYFEWLAYVLAWFLIIVFLGGPILITGYLFKALNPGGHHEKA